MRQPDETEAEEVDPVCGMTVDADQAHDLGLEADVNGQAVYFCGAGCHAAFMQDPTRYVAPEREEPPPV